MSHKKANQRIHTQNPIVSKANESKGANRTPSKSSSGVGDVVNMAKTYLNSAADTVGSNWKLIGATAAACGTAAFLLGTSSGRQVRSNIQSRLSDFYGQASDQVSTGYTAIRDRIRDMTSSELVPKESDLDLKVQKLQDKFRLAV
jgi:hypothetical protein